MTSCFDNPSHMMTGSNNVGPGWHGLIRDLEEKLNAIDPDFTIQQVKEKFGGLRYYADTSQLDEFTNFHGLIAKAEADSFTMCEECGKPAEPRSLHGWVKTLCDEHREEYEQRRAGV